MLLRLIVAVLNIFLSNPWLVELFNKLYTRTRHIPSCTFNFIQIGIHMKMVMGNHCTSRMCFFLLGITFIVEKSFIFRDILILTCGTFSLF